MEPQQCWPRENVCAFALHSFIFQDYCTRMHRFFRQPPTMLAVVAFVCMHHAASANNSQHCWTNNVVTCCVRFCKGLQGVTQQVKLIGTLTCVLRITICAFAFHVFYDRFVALLFRYSVVTGITWRSRNLARCTRGGSTTMVSWVTGLRRSTR